MEDVETALTLDAKGDSPIIHGSHPRNAHVDAVSLSRVASSAHIDPSEIPISVYTPLKDWQTRILCVEPGAPGQPLVTQLLPVDLIYFEGVVITETQTKVFYEALSDSWGLPHFNHWIKCNGQDFLVSGTVFKVLQQLRHLDKVRHLWIDAIVLNQLDPVEKSAQVQKIFTIFKKATQVIIWLDEEQDTVALRYLELVQDTPPNLGAKSVVRTDCVTEIRPGLINIGRRRYFTRCWIRQEIFAARKLVVQVGSFALSWKAISTLFDHVEYLSQPASISGSPIRSDARPPRFAWSGILRQGSREQLSLIEAGDVGFDGAGLFSPSTEKVQDLDLGRILLTSSISRASDDRDLIYGILGMSNANTQQTGDEKLGHASETSALPIDYTSWTPDWQSLDYKMHQEDWRQKYSWNFGKAPTQRYNNDGVLHISGLFYGVLDCNEGDASFGIVPNTRHPTLWSHQWSPFSEANKFVDLTCFRSIPAYDYIHFSYASPDRLRRRDGELFIPKTTISGDVVVLPHGIRHPIVLRRVGQHQYRFLGPILSDDFIFGELYSAYGSEEANLDFVTYAAYLAERTSEFQIFELV